MEKASSTKLAAIGFGLGFTAFLVTLIYAREADAVWAIWIALAFAVLTVILLVVLLAGNPQAKSHSMIERLVFTPSTRVENPYQTPDEPEEVPVATEGYRDYPGLVYPVLDIEGIGPIYATRLQDAGIATTAHLSYVGAERVAEVAQVPLKTAQSWLAMAELAKISGIGKQYAEALVRGGIMSIEALVAGDAELMSGQVTAYLASLKTSVLGQEVSAKRIASWQRKAATMSRMELPIPDLRLPSLVE